MTWTAEPHGDGLGVYSGRSAERHGLRLFNIVDGDMQFDLNIKFMLDAVNSHNSLLARIDELERERDAAWNEALEAAAKWLSSPGSDGMPVSGILTLKRP